MQKLTALFIALSPAAVVLFGGVFLYTKAPTTPMLILLLLASFSSVILGIVIYNRKQNSYPMETTNLITWDAIEIEEDMLPIFPEEFVVRMRSQTGTIWILNQPFSSGLVLESSTFDKLRNITTLQFNQGYKIELKKCSLINVGDNQLGLKDLDQLSVYKNSKLLFNALDKGKYWFIEQDNTSNHYKVDGPVLVFQWRDEE